MVMIATMINCVKIMMPAPLARAHDHRRDPDSLATAGAVDPDDPAAAWSFRDDLAAAMLRASSSGSGRNRTQSTTPAAAYAAAPSRNGPASGGMPTAVARAPVRLTRLGPMIAPMAVATSTMLTARPRRLGAARSAPAYRACKLVATPAP